MTKEILHTAKIRTKRKHGRFLSVDPLWESFRNYNPYHYSYNNPVSFKDPTGLAPEPNEKEDEILSSKEDEIQNIDNSYLEDLYRSLALFAARAKQAELLFPHPSTLGLVQTYTYNLWGGGQLVKSYTADCFGLFTIGVSGGSGGSDGGGGGGAGGLGIGTPGGGSSSDGNTGVTSGSSNGTISGIDSNDPDVINNVKTNFNTTLQEMRKAAEFFPEIKKVVDSFSKIFGNYEIYMMSDSKDGELMVSSRYLDDNGNGLNVRTRYLQHIESGNKSGTCTLPMNNNGEKNGIIYLNILSFADAPDDFNCLTAVMSSVIDEFNHARLNLEGSNLRGMAADRVLYKQLEINYNQITDQSIRKYYWQFNSINTSLYKQNGGL